MEKPISVGDLVQVVRGMPCCGAERALGWTFKVSAIRLSQKSHCAICKTSFQGTSLADGHPSWHPFQLHRLKRIPPLGELGQRTLDEMLKETA